MNFFSEVSRTHTHAHTQTGLEATRVDFRLFGECVITYHSLILSSVRDERDQALVVEQWSYSCTVHLFLSVGIGCQVLEHTHYPDW